MKTLFLLVLVFISSFSKSQSYMKLAGDPNYGEECVSGITSNFTNGGVSTGKTDIQSYYFWSRQTSGSPIGAMPGFTTNGKIVLQKYSTSCSCYNNVNVYVQDIVELDEQTGIFAIAGYIKEPNLPEDIFIQIVKSDGEILCTKYIEYVNNNQPAEDICRSITVGDVNPLTNFRDIYLTGSTKPVPLASSSAQNTDLVIMKLAFSIINQIPNLSIVWDQKYDISKMSSTNIPSDTFSEEGFDIYYNQNGSFFSGKLLVVGKISNINSPGIGYGLVIDINEVTGGHNPASPFTGFHSTIGTIPGNWFNKIQVDNNNDIFLLGCERDASNFDYEIFLLKFNSTGTLLWEKHYDNIGKDDYFNSFVVVKNNISNAGNIHIIGYLNYSGKQQIRVLNLDNNGNNLPIGHAQIGTNLFDEFGIDISEDPNGGFLNLHCYAEDQINFMGTTNSSPQNHNLLAIKSDYDFSDVNCSISFDNDLNIVDQMFELSTLDFRNHSGCAIGNLTWIITDFVDFEYCGNNLRTILPDAESLISLNLGPQIFPNPVKRGNSIINVKFDNQVRTGKLVIFDNTGKLVFKYDFENCNYLPLEIANSLDPGIYIMKLEVDSKNHYRKLIIE